MKKAKLKYRDVVGGRKSNTKSRVKSKRDRKTFSLYKGDHEKQGKKRKGHFKHSKPEEAKRLMKEESVPVGPLESEDEAEERSEINQLLLTFSSKIVTKQSLAADSSDDSSSSEELEVETSVPDQQQCVDDVTEEDDERITIDHQDEVLEESESNEAEIDNNDQFVKHLCYDLHENSLTSLQNPSFSKDHTLQWPSLGKLVFKIPEFEISEKNLTGEFTIEDKKTFAPPGTLPHKTAKIDLAQLQKLGVKSQIIKTLADSKLLGCQQVFSEMQSELFSVINNYQDLCYLDRKPENLEEIRFVYCLHAVNHILKTRLKVIHHNARLSKKDDVPEEFRDQGLVRPKVLIVVPFKDSAYKVIQTIIDILMLDDKGHVMNKKRFIEEYTGNEIFMPKKNPKPEDYESTFTGNTSDDFRIGITVTKKSLKLFADFYSSDIIIASPLGLRTVIGAEGEAERDFDFLASIELLIMDQTEIFFMQNWDHVYHIFNHLHLQPKDSHGTDFSRVRTWSLNGWSKFYRQTLIFSSIVLPEIISIFNKKCFNYAGKARVVNTITAGSIGQVVLQIPHVFYKFETTSVQQCIEARFEFFINKILPQQKDSLMKSTLVYISNYFDYVRLRNYFKREDLNFVQICEYSKEGKIARARDMFFHGDAHFLLYTERHHFFNRLRIKGIQHLVFYQPPNFPHFYHEICNLMERGNMNKKICSTSNMSVSVIYSKYDYHQLAAVVGSEKASKMLNSERFVHMMVTGSH